MQNGQHDDIEYLRDAMDDAARELDASRAEALETIDRALFSWFHVKVCLVASTGFFMEAYDIFAINLASVMIGYMYGHTTEESSGQSLQLSPHQVFGIKVAAQIGSLFGQLLFGWLADILGRKRMYGIELMIVITATLIQALVGNGSGPAHGDPTGTGWTNTINIIGAIAFWRFFMDIGVGGDHLLSAVITSEFASTRLRGRLMTAVFTVRGWESFVASLVAFIVVASYIKSSFLAEILDSVDYCWRILIGFGFVPGVIALYFRLTIPEAPRFTMDIDRDVQRATIDVSNVLGPIGNTAGMCCAEAVVQRAEVPRRSLSDSLFHVGQWPNFRRLFGVAYSWFALDLAFYGLGLNPSTILKSKVLMRTEIPKPVTRRIRKGPKKKRKP